MMNCPFSAYEVLLRVWSFTSPANSYHVQVEDQLFKVHRYFLSRESQVFHWMFACPPRGDGQEGDSDDKPIRLPNVTPKEFESLLDFFYKKYATYACDHLTWISILILHP